MKSPLASAAAWNAAGWVAGSVQGLVLTALLVRCAGAEAFGTWATFLAWRAFLFVFDHGLGQGIARDTTLWAQGDVAAARRVRAGFLLYGLLALGAPAVLGLLGGPTAALLGLPFDAGTSLRPVAALLAFETFLAFVTAPLAGVARGRERFEVAGGAQVLQAAVVVIGAFGLLRSASLTHAAQTLWIARAVGCLFLVACVVLLRLLPRAAQAPRQATPALAPVVRFALPLVLMALALQIGTASDVPIVGAFFGAEAASAYALGTKLPLAGLGLLGAITTAALPRLVAARGEPRIAIAALLALGATLGTIGFLGIMLYAEGLLRLWVGEAPSLAVLVTVLYAAAYLLNVPAHVLSLAAIAGDRHRLMSLIVAGEAVVNLGLSWLLARLGYSSGPAWATLVTLFVSNVLVLPPLLRAQLGLSWPTLLRPVAFGVAVGAAGAGAVRLLTGDVLVAGALTVMLAAAALDLTLRRRSALAWLWRMTWHRGFEVRWRQAREIAAERKRLAQERALSPYVWVKDAPPLVTVRIATFNRGPLVAERAIASAQAQTHRHLEILVVGDCCDEATAAAVRSVRDPRLRFVNLTERGRYPSDPRRRWMVAGASPMNHALQILRGDWIAPLDDDDEFTPDHVAVLLDACRTRDLDFAWGKALTEQKDGSWVEVGAPALRHGSIVHAAVLYSARLRRFQHDVECWRVDEPGDWNLWRRFHRAGARMGFVDQVVCRHYVEARAVRSKTPVWLGAAAEKVVLQPAEL